MTPDPAVVIAATPRDWAQRLHRHLADHGGGRIRATVLSAHETSEERYDVLVVDDTTSFLSPRLVERLHQEGRTILGLYDPQDPHGKSELVECGVDEALPCDIETVALVAAIGQLAGARALNVTQSVVPMAPAPHPAQAPAPVGRVMTVLGPGGGCGATEIALALAASIAARERVILVETDEERGCLAPRLGLPPYPNLRSGLEQVRRGAGLAIGALQPVSERLGVLVAGPLATRGPGVPPDDLGLLLDDLRRHADWVILDGGADGRRLVVAGAAQVVVGQESPVGVMRLCTWLRERAADRPHVVLNRCSGSTFRRYEIAAEVGRATEPASLVTLPEDSRVGEAAWHGRVVARGPFTRAVEGLATAITTMSPEARA
jgi:Flp pilus assembly CpaE family ATPase